jgi:hypothetical protein
MTRGKGKYILSSSERAGLLEEKRDLENALREAERGEYGKGTRASVDTAALRREIARIEDALQKGEAPKLTPEKREEMVKEAEMLKERITQGMPTRYEMDHPAKCPGAIQKHLNWDKRTEGDKARYRFIMKQIEPDDPTACDLEKFRKEK